MRSLRSLAAAAVLGAVLAPGAQAQDEPIQDNSFLIQEAYNQPRGVVQHVFTAEPDANGETVFTFGQEWPIGGVRHQFGFAVPVFCPCGEAERSVGLGDVELGYRYQAAGARGGRVHVAPELLVALPTGRAGLGRGADEVTFGVTVPVSVALARRLVAHANAGATLTTETWMAGGSLVWLARPKLNLLLEGVWDGERGGSAFTLSPGVRGAIELGRVQVVPGIAVPVVFDEGEHSADWLLYLSVEHPFRGTAP